MRSCTIYKNGSEIQTIQNGRPDRRVILHNWLIANQLEFSEVKQGIDGYYATITHYIDEKGVYHETIYSII